MKISEKFKSKDTFIDMMSVEAAYIDDGVLCVWIAGRKEKFWNHDKDIIKQFREWDGLDCYDRDKLEEAHKATKEDSKAGEKKHE